MAPRLTTLALILSLAPACATTPKGIALQASVGVTGAMDVYAAGWGPYVHAVVEECRGVLPGDASEKTRKECLGLAGYPDEVDAAASAVVAAQRAVQIAAECDENPVEIPKEFLSECVEGRQADWKSLASDLADAWKVFSPYVQALAKKGS